MTSFKKCNAVDHLKSNAHATAVKRLREKRSSVQTEGQKIAAAISTSEKTIVEHVSVFSSAQKSQLIKKFSLVHFIAVNNKPLNFYQQLVRFDKDSIKSKSKLNDAAEEQLVVTYYLFKRTNLKWHLFKRHALLMKKSPCRYKRPFGTRWVAHQSDALEAFLHNLDLLLGYLNNQIADPYNTTMKKETPHLEGVLASCSDLITLVYQYVKVDLLKLIRPTLLILESVSILLPEAITTIGVTLKKVKKLLRKLIENGVNALQDEFLFPSLKNEFLPSLDFDKQGINLGKSTCKDPAYTGVTTFAGYTLNRENLETALSKVYDDVMLVLPALELALDERLSFLANDPVISSAAVLLETTGYQNREEEDLAEHFRQSLEANGYVKQRLCEFPFAHQFYNFLVVFLHP